MTFLYEKAWRVIVKTSVGECRLLVDTGAVSTCFNIKDLTKLLNVSVLELTHILEPKGYIMRRTISNDQVKLYPLTLPKIMVGDRLFPQLHCLVSLNENFASVLGMDVLNHGITTLQFKQRGNCSPFDYTKYNEQYANKPTNTLAFLDYT